MNSKEIKDKLNYNEVENNVVYLPNEIFKDFKGIEGNSTNRAFCFSFYYLITYLYRTTKYGTKNYSVQDLKEILGYSRTNQTMDKFIKKNGVMEKMCYLSHTTNYPTYWTFDEDEQVPVFIYYEDFINEHDIEEMQHFREHMGLFLSRRNKSIKVPVKGLYRNKESLNNKRRDGTFFGIRNTTQINMDTFLFCMSRKELGIEAFWIYSFIKYMNEYYGSDWNVSQTDMSKVIGVGLTKLNEVLNNLEIHDMIYNDHKDFIVGLPKEVKVKGCSYRAKNSKDFEVVKKEIEKREVVGFATWCYQNDIDYGEYIKNGVIKKFERCNNDENPFANDDPFSGDDDFSWTEN